MLTLSVVGSIALMAESVGTRLEKPSQAASNGPARYLTGLRLTRAAENKRYMANLPGALFGMQLER